MDDKFFKNMIRDQLEKFISLSDMYNITNINHVIDIEKGEIVLRIGFDTSTNMQNNYSIDDLIDAIQTKHDIIEPRDTKPTPVSVQRELSINAAPGIKVRFIDENGYDSDRDFAKKHLNIVDTYTVDKIDIGGWDSKVYLKEVPGESFNTVMFVLA